MVIYLKKIHPDAEIPSRKHPGDVGFDLKAVSVEYDEANDAYIYHTGLVLATDPETSLSTNSILIFPRSSNKCTNHYLTNSVGIVDSDEYRGEIMVVYKDRTSLDQRIINQNLNDMMLWIHQGNADGLMYDELYGKLYDEVLSNNEAYLRKQASECRWAPYKIGERVAQLVFMDTLSKRIEFQEVDRVNTTERGTGGYGSTGK